MTTHTFQTEVKQLLDIVIHSLYSEKEIFLRELISNASDACDKLRFQSLTDQDLLKGDSDLKISVDYNDEDNTIVIQDNGIGMTEEEAIENLGTIAKSGTKEFLKKFQEKSDDLSGLIGQFGVGFYASFMVADKISVESRSAKVSSDEGVRWESAGDGDFATEQIAKPQRGTTITLHLKEEEKEFAEQYRLRTLIKKYSDFVTYPVFLPKMETPETKEGEDAKPAVKGELEQVNEGKALWKREKSGITEDEYKEFYKTACKAWDEPESKLHFSVEGRFSFTALLYIPSSKPFDMFDKNKKGLSLYVRNVFIADDCDELLPEYLRFVKGVVDCDDLPLNVSREILQQQGALLKLKKQLVKKILDHLTKLAKGKTDEDKESMKKIDENFGALLKEGLVNDFENKDKIIKLVRYQSTHTMSTDEKEKTSLAEYKERMKEGQEAIYFLTASNMAAAQNSPHIEGYKSKGYEVLLMTDPVDEWVAQSLTEFDGTKTQNISKGDSDLSTDEEKKELEKKSEEAKPFLEFCKESTDGIKEVRFGSRLTDSPCCVVADTHDMSNNMEEIMKQFGQEAPAAERILELNPEHDLIKKLQAVHSEDDKSEKVKDYVALLRDQALLAEGSKIKDQAAFATNIGKLMGEALA